MWKFPCDCSFHTIVFSFSWRNFDGISDNILGNWQCDGKFCQIVYIGKFRSDLNSDLHFWLNSCYLSFKKLVGAERKELEKLVKRCSLQASKDESDAYQRHVINCLRHFVFPNTHKSDRTLRYFYDICFAFLTLGWVYFCIGIIGCKIELGSRRTSPYQYPRCIFQCIWRRYLSQQ